MPTNAHLVSTVKNTSGGSLTLSFWPPHGIELADEDEVTVIGDIFSALLRGRKPERNIDSFMTLLLAGDLALIKTPAPVLYDAVDDRTMVLQLKDGALYAVDPSWGSSEFSSAL